MSATLTRAAYAELLRSARRHARRADEAEDLLHEALAAALRDGRAMGSDARAWLGGVMRNMARMQARSAVRRRKREAAWREDADGPVESSERALDSTTQLPTGLPPSLRVVLLLSLTGHSRAEIRHLLRLSDEALRQRIVTLRRRLTGTAEAPPEPRLAGALAFGSVRRNLLPVARRVGHLATHDPDGHGIVLNFSRRPAHETAAGGN